MGLPSSISTLSKETLDNIATTIQRSQCEEDETHSESSLDMSQPANCHLRKKGPIMRKYNRKEKGAIEIICGWIVEHQIGLPINLLALLSLTHLCFPRARRHSRKFFELSYYNAETGEYRAGWNDAWMVFYWIVVFTGLRAAVMDYGLVALAAKRGIKAKRDRIRFAEQAWLLLYYLVFWTLGMYIMINSEYWLNFKELWTNWPNREIGGLRKWYILVQFAFWLQQIMVINVEKRRKDHWQMLTHHIVTTILIFTSYGYHQTRVANLILCIMDVVDIILPIAKCLRYLGYTTLCDIVFGLFMLVWFVARHIIYMMICWSVYKDIPINIKYGCYRGKNGAITGPFTSPDGISHLFEPFRDPEGLICWNDSIKWGFLSALLFLQGITLIWFWMIIQVALRVLRGGQADDSRSDDEEDTEEVIMDDLDDAGIIQHQDVADQSIGLDVKVSNIGRSKYIRKASSSATGVSLPEHMDRQDLLGRISCDKSM
ncbi:hypothetical protein Golomagni_02797 [Golovinomyces magnicellulatus]|nr:hypothetical protein Golomagni_02797 [Golovinomyces magnicellulatus]